MCGTAYDDPSMHNVPRGRDGQAAVAARDEAMSRVEEQSAPWRAVAFDVLTQYAREHVLVTSEDVWDALDERDIPRPVEGRAMGPVMMKAVRSGVLEPVGFQSGSNPKHHRDIQRMYRSLVLE